jgi:hypothetical protein
MTTIKLDIKRLLGYIEKESTAKIAGAKVGTPPIKRPGAKVGTGGFKSPRRSKSD